MARRIFPVGTGFERTVEGRRMRLCRYVSVARSRLGWAKLGWNVFKDHSPGSGRGREPKSLGPTATASAAIARTTHERSAT